MAFLKAVSTEERTLYPLVFGLSPWQFFEPIFESILPSAGDIMPSDHPFVPKDRHDPAAIAPAIDVDAWRRNIRQTTFAGYHLHMAIALWNEGSHQVALEALQRALNEKPDFSLASLRLTEFLHQIGRHDEAERIERAARAGDPLYPASAYADLGESTLDAREAVQAFGKACALHANPAWELSLIEALEKTNTVHTESEFSESIAIPRHILTLDPARTTALQWLGYKLFALSSMEEAERCFSRSMLLDPGNVFFRAMLAMARVALGDTDGALAPLRERSPEEARIGLLPNTRGLVSLAQGDVEGALAHYSEAVRIEPDNAFLRSGLGLALQEIGRIDEALRYHNAADDNGLVCLHRAIAWHRAGNEEKARSELRRLLALHPVFAWSWARVYRWASPYLLATLESIATDARQAPHS
ncbi:tetratricopeptide repeat protein [Azospirillum brasilense]|nr:tetratricopeptide repeat protein [Azospirillum brasilense]